MIGYASPANTPDGADATAEFYAALSDPSRWIVKPGVPVFKPHVRTDPNTGKEIRVDLSKLHEIAHNMARLEKDGGVPVRITLGHTQPGQPETKQPPVAGYYRNARVGVFGPKREPAIIADEWLDPQFGPVRKNYPYRSSEYYDDDKHITGVALLSRDPFLDLGVVAYARGYTEPVPGPVLYGRAGGTRPYRYTFGDQPMPAPQYGHTPPAAGTSYYPQHGPPAAAPVYGPLPAPAVPNPVMYAHQPHPPAPTDYARPTPYRGPWPGPAHTRADIGHAHASNFLYAADGGGRNRPVNGAMGYGQPSRIQGPQRPQRPQRPAPYRANGRVGRYDDMGMYGPDDDTGLGGGMPPGMGAPPGMGGMPASGPPGMGGDPGMGGMPPEGMGQGGQAQIVGLLEQVVQLLEAEGGLPPNDTPGDSPFPPGSEGPDLGGGGLGEGPDDLDDDQGGSGEEGYDPDQDDDEPDEYGRFRGPTSYAPPRMDMGGWSGQNGMRAVGSQAPPPYTPGRGTRGTVTGQGGFNAAPIHRPSALGVQRGVVGAPRPTQNNYRTPQRPAPYRAAPGRPVPRPAPRYYQKDTAVPNPAPPQAPRPVAGGRIRDTRIAYELQEIKRQNQVLMYEREVADNDACLEAINGLAAQGYPVDQYELDHLKALPRDRRPEYLNTIVTRYSRVPADGVPYMAGDPTPAQAPQPQAAPMTREQMDAALALDARGVPYHVAVQYARAGQDPTTYAAPQPQAQAQPGYGMALPPGGQPQFYPYPPQQFGDPYQGS